MLNSLIKNKKDFYIKKDFTLRLNLNKLESHNPRDYCENITLVPSLTNSNILLVKTSIYKLLKKYKVLKSLILINPKDEQISEILNNFGLKLEKSGFYTSLLEKQRKQFLRRLENKLNHFRSSSYLSERRGLVLFKLRGKNKMEKVQKIKFWGKGEKIHEPKQKDRKGNERKSKEKDN